MKIFLMSVLTLMIALLPSCGEESSVKKQGSSVQHQASSIEDQASNIKHQTSTPWPFITDDQTETGLAANLTAKNYLLIFDGSGSMDETNCSGNRRKIEVAKEAVIEWSKTVPQNANLGLVAFHQDGWSTLPLVAGQGQGFINTVRNLTAGGRTPLSQAFQDTYEALTRQGKRQLGYGDYTIVVVTDGIANDESILSTWVTHILASSPLNIHTIGFCIGHKHSLNQPGQTIYKAADNPKELRRGLEEVLAESQTFDDSDFNE